MGAPKVPDDIRSYLVNTAGITVTISVFALSATPINQYAIIEYAGLSNDHVHGASVANVAFDNSLIQIQSRHTSRQTARDNLLTVVDYLDGLQDVTINSRLYTYMERISSIRLHEVQDDGSAVFITEFRIQSAR